MCVDESKEETVFLEGVFGGGYRIPVPKLQTKIEIKSGKITLITNHNKIMPNGLDSISLEEFASPKNRCRLCLKCLTFQTKKITE